MPQTTECAQKAALAEEIRVAIKSILEIHNAEVERVLAGDFGTREATERSLKSAREAKALVIDRYRDHVSSHGC
jgi:metal-sulfur cluster biosynthetic enzyme